MIWALAATCLVAAIFASLRWLRIAQREHYLAGSVARFALRWWTTGLLNLSLFGLALVGVVGSAWEPWLAFLVPLAQVGPVGLTIRGRTTPLAWTGRLRRVAIVTGILAGGVFVGGSMLDLAPVVALGLFLLPVLVDLSLLVLGPIEHRMGDRWVEQARARLAASGARVVAITGSYGKTSTKLYTAHLLAGTHRVVASPASFNNRMGLARAINEQLVPGTEVFVAEMGTYGPGEIAEMCSWIHPEVSAIVSIGPVHLERFKSEEMTLAAKSEILDRARVGVIATDQPILQHLAEDRSETMEVIGVGHLGDRVRIAGGQIVADGETLGPVPEGAIAVNLAVAVGICLALGVEPGRISGRLDGVPRPEHRQTVSRSERGFTVIDDTYNSNPAGARLALERLVEAGAGGRKVLVTPGMVEMGPRQHVENRALAEAASKVVDDVIVVGATNRRALTDGSAGGRASVTVVGTREQAVTWVREHLGPGDAVLYENDLPDHYP